MAFFICGQSVGDFTLVRLLARGGLSKIWLARSDDRLVAIKMLCRDDRWNNDEYTECRRYFENEARWLMKLRHPNLVRGLGSFEDEGVPMIVLDFIEGQSLRQWLDANATPRSLEKFHKIARGVTAAVKYLHQQGLMHRDIKPSNVMVTSELETRLIDLEFVRTIPLASEQLDRPMSGEIGAWAFAAPELMDRLDERYDERVDVYSLGALLIELLVGRPPRRLPPVACRSDVPHTLSNLLWSMVDERPENRPNWADIAPILLPSKARE